MAKEIIITISDDGVIEIEGKGLKPGEEIKDVAKFVTDTIAEVTELGHKHSHSVAEHNREIQR